VSSAFKIAPGAALLAVAACGGIARTPEQYRDDTAKLLEAQSGVIQQCYARELAADRNAKGKVTLRFDVARRTGKIIRITQDPARTTASSALAQCVVKAIEPLELHPPDKQVGEATFTWELEPLAPAVPPKDAPAPPAS
jgi:hypothetical protein